MTDDREILARRALALRLLADRVKSADTDNRAAIEAQFNVKDRAVVWLPLDGRDVEIGHVRRDKGTVTATVVGLRELIDWVEANYPSEVEEYQPAPVTRIRPAFLDSLLAQAKDHGAPVDDNGEYIPGIDVSESDPRTVVVPSRTDQAQAALIEQMRADPYALQSLLALPAGET